MKKPILILVAVLLFGLVGAVTALTINGGMVTFSEFKAKNFDIKPSEPPESGSLIDTLSESNFEIDEDGNVTVPNLLAFGDPPVAAIATDGGAEWAYGTVQVTGGGAWVDSHPVAAPSGAACAIINPYDNVFSGPVTFSSAIQYTKNTYVMWPGSGSCTITNPKGNVTACKVEPTTGYYNVKITALDSFGNVASVPAGAEAQWEAGFTLLGFHRYTCGIARDPSVDTANILEWKLASLDASREPDDQFFVFVKDENGDWFNEDALCESSGCFYDSHYKGLEVAWVVWKVPGE
jgi:hypothetical protein